MGTKYHSKSIIVNGIKFQSKKEGTRYKELLLMEETGEIHDLQRQVKFSLLPSQRIDGKVVERECAYIADFVYYDSNDNKVVEDVKGYKGGAAYSMFIIKRKMMLYFYGIRIKEV